MERIINGKFEIADDEIVKEEIYEITGEEPNMDLVEEYIVSNPSCIYYFDMDMRIKNETDKDIKMAWLDTGKKTSTGAPIMISLLNYNGYYSGYFTGAPYYLVNGMCRRNPKQTQILKANLVKFNEKYRKMNGIMNVSTSETGKAETENVEANIVMPCESKMTNVTEEIYKQLLFPNWKSIRGLDRFLKITGTRIKQLVAKGRTEYFIENTFQSVIINTGMMNLFGSDLLVLYRFYEKYQTYIAESLIHGKQDYLDNGFTKEQASVVIEPMNFFDEDDENFKPTYEDFDINQGSLIHIIQERKSRFPESVRSQSDIKIANQLMNALQRGIKMQQRDHSFAKASYSGKGGYISWFMPLHIDAPLNESPELVMAIKKSGAFYEIKTILPFGEDILDRITAVSLYNRVWG